MSYENNQKKTFVLINEKANPALLLNAVSHTVLGLREKISSGLNFLNYPFKDELSPSKISEYPVIIMKANNSNKILSLRRELDVCEHEVIYNCFTAEMIAENADKQISANFNADPPEFWVIAFFGDSEALRPLTKKFSLYK